MPKILKRYNSTMYGDYRRAYLLYGLISGAVLALAYWIEMLLSNPTDIETLAIDLILAVVIFMAAYRYRSTLPGGKVTMKELLLLGVGQGLVAALVYGLLLWLLMDVAYPEQVDILSAHRIDLIRANEEGTDLEQAIVTTQNYTAIHWAFIASFRVFVLSILFAFFSAILMRTEKAPVREKEHSGNNN